MFIFKKSLVNIPTWKMPRVVCGLKRGGKVKFIYFSL